VSPPHRELTRQQRAALIGWHFGNGESLAPKDVAAMTGLSVWNALALLGRLKACLDLVLLSGRWALGGTAHPRTGLNSQQRAAVAAVLLAQHGEISSPELAGAFGMTCQGMNAMLRSLSQVLPIYEPPAGTWLVCHMREEESGR
jgi:hypothetical protein